VPALGLVTLHKRESVVGVPVVDRASVVPTVAGPTAVGFIMPTNCRNYCCRLRGAFRCRASVVPTVVGLPL